MPVDKSLIDIQWALSPKADAHTKIYLYISLFSPAIRSCLRYLSAGNMLNLRITKESKKLFSKPHHYTRSINHSYWFQVTDLNLCRQSLELRGLCKRADPFLETSMLYTKISEFHFNKHNRWPKKLGSGQIMFKRRSWDDVSITTTTSTRSVSRLTRATKM